MEKKSKAPCKNCPYRSIYCHSICMEYKEFSKRNEEKKKIINKYLKDEAEIYQWRERGKRRKIYTECCRAEREL